MSPVTVTWSMVAAVCLTLGLVHGVAWWYRRQDLPRLLFAVAASSVAALAFFELSMMNAPSVEVYGRLHRWGHVSVFLIVVSIVWFLHLYLQAGARWLAWLITALRCVVLVINFYSPVSMNFVEIDSLVAFRLFGEDVNVASGTAHPWISFAEFTMVLVVLFALQATIQTWRRGQPSDRQRAAVIGSSVALFCALSLTNAMLVHHGLVVLPYFFSFIFTVVVITMSFGLSMDLLKASETADELEASKARLELAAESARMGFWDYDEAQDRFWTSAQIPSLFGFQPGEPITLASWLEKVHPDDREAMLATAETLIEHGGRVRADYRIKLPAGEVRWLAIWGRSSGTGRGKHYGIVLDYTEQHDAEHERNQLREQLAHSGRVTMLGQLASSLAHELSQPLGAILRNTEAAEMLMETASPDLGELRAILADIRRDDQRAGKVIARLRGLFRHHVVHQRLVGVGGLVDEVMALVRAEASIKNIDLRREIDTGDATVRGDAVHLQQVLLNLVMNAMDAAAAAAGARFVRVRAARRDDQMLELVVSDSGHGVDPANAQRIFEPFFTTKTTGMGMGLAICRTIIEAHGGRIWLDPEPGSGAVFRFTLPLAVEPGALEPSDATCPKG